MGGAQLGSETDFERTQFGQGVGIVEGARVVAGRIEGDRDMALRSDPVVDLASAALQVGAQAVGQLAPEQAEHRLAAQQAFLVAAQRQRQVGALALGCLRQHLGCKRRLHLTHELPQHLDVAHGAMARRAHQAMALDQCVEAVAVMLGVQRARQLHRTQHRRIEALADARKLENQIANYASRRVAVVSTGSELLAGEIEDTNFAAIRSAMEDAGFEVEFGGIAGDSEAEIAGIVARLSGEGFGIIITTGGVGAEDKDHTIEAIERLDPDLSTAVLAQYTRGHGRHVKDAVRIAIAQIGWSTVFALPGPTHEVKLALPIIIDGLKAKTNRNDLVEAIAAPLRSTLPHQHHHH